MSDLLSFWRNLVRNPRRISAVTPSGPALARLITSEIDRRSAPVVELGPGTGVFTRQMIERGLDERDLVLVEYGADFARALAQRFPQATVLNRSAAALDGLVLPHGAQGAGAVVSGLPLLTMPPDTVLQIFRGAFSLLREGGHVYQFTYGKHCPVPPDVLGRLNLTATRLGMALANLPPATVYRIGRAPAARA